MKLKLKRPSSAKARPPKILHDLYRDMRDRRLISISIALVIAIVAVPVLMRGSDDGASPAGPASGVVTAPPIDGVEQLDPVVLTDVPGLRDFRERLGQYQSKNPFKQQLGAPPATGGGESTGGSSSALPTQDSSSAAVDTAADPAAVDPTTIDTAPPTGATSSDPAPVDTKPDPKPPPAALITFRLDVRVGPVGDTKVEKDVRSLAVLPDRRRPVVQYVESNIAGTTASFIVSPDAVALKGDGNCDPSPENCRFLLMDAGDDQTFRYGPDGLVYRLELLDIDRHSQPLTGRSDSAKRAVPGYDSATFTSTVTGE